MSENNKTLSLGSYHQPVTLDEYKHKAAMLKEAYAYVMSLKEDPRGLDLDYSEILIILTSRFFSVQMAIMELERVYSDLSPMDLAQYENELGKIYKDDNKP